MTADTTAEATEKRLRYLGTLVDDVSKSRSYSTQISGVLIAPCDSYGTPNGFVSADPTIMEWGVRYPSGNIEIMEEADARRFAAVTTDLRPDLPTLVVHRVVTDWEVPNE